MEKILELINFKTLTATDGKVFSVDKERFINRLNDIIAGEEASLESERECYEFEIFKFDEEAFFNGDKKHIDYVLSSLVYANKFMNIKCLRASQFYTRDFAIDKNLFTSNQFSYRVFKYVLENLTEPTHYMQMEFKPEHILEALPFIMIEAGKLSMPEFISDIDVTRPIHIISRDRYKDKKELTEIIQLIVSNKTMDELNKLINIIIENDFVKSQYVYSLVSLVKYINETREDKKESVVYIPNYKKFSADRLMDIISCPNKIRDKKEYNYLVDKLKMIADPIIICAIISNNNFISYISDAISLTMDGWKNYEELLRVINVDKFVNNLSNQAPTPKRERLISILKRLDAENEKVLYSKDDALRLIHELATEYLSNDVALVDAIIHKHK